jgi:choice-of-anchor C domain-containing protein
MRVNRYKGLLNAAAILAAGCLVMMPAKADLVANGMFADPGKVNFQPGVTGTTIPNWTVSTGNVDWIGTFWAAPPSGGFSVDLDGTNSAGAIQQSVNTVSGQTYDLKFYLSGNAGGAPPIKNLNVSIDADTPAFTFDTSSGGAQGDVWTLESFVFKATTNGTTLTFASADTGNNLSFGPVIGGVSLNAAPEPTFYGVLAMGLAGLAFAAFRRRSRSTV